ncbi:glycosyl hydrolase [Fulvivirga sp.]|uniref:VPS10 domain-containing protein n=1 Tax=Fulvivirga sp. TaxID=1931237 RepID=UPI0032EC74E7
MKKLAISLLLMTISVFTFGQDYDELLKPVKYRNIGPFRGGRAVAGAGVVGDPMTYYMGTTGGGVWKTENGGQRWFNISDGFFKTGSVGAIAVSESDPNVVYVGMGEHAPRGVMTSYGDGVYKSTDAGKTWTHLGLEKTQHIARVVIHPKNPDIVFVAAQGALHGNNAERGIYKSTDGGKSWSNVLFVNGMTGCAELSMDYNNPMVLYAAMWEHQRLPWQVISGGPGSGLYKSTDGGVTWNKIHKGLPEEKGKMAIAVARSNSDKVYALIESDSDKELGGLFVSNNAGASWSRVSDNHELIQRAWYYIEVFVDPQDEETVYVMNAPALRSIDGGKSWESLSGTHGDYHDLWINPDNNKNMAIVNDGGVAVSYNYGEYWSSEDNMPTAQFYRINVDNLFPYNIYAGQQDNSTVKIASLAHDDWSINTRHWSASAGGESAFLAFDPDNPRFVMGGSYLGTIEVFDTKSSATTNVMAAPIQYLSRAASDMKYRFDWNAPIIWSKHEPGTFYHGAQVLLRTRDMGKSWEEVSPDLTKNEKAKQIKGGGPYTVEAVGAENYGVLSYVLESPSEKGVIYTGSNDGLVHVTKDNGATWTNVTPKGLTECLVNAIEVSPHDPATVYIATTRYKFNDKTPSIYKSTNYGKSWTNISGNIPYGAFTRVVREDDKVKDLLFAGTELGMYISKDGGKSWKPFQLNLPIVPITDLRIHKDDLIVATMGRSFWILDDMGLIRQHKPSTGLVLYQPEDAIIGNWGSQLNGNSESFTGSNAFEGVNPANGVVIYYNLPKLDDAAEVKLQISDAQGNVVRTYTSKKDKDFKSYDGGPSANPTLSKNEGLNRIVWDMRYPTMVGAPTAYIEGGFRGHKAVPGDYKIAVMVGDQKMETSAKILPNPLYTTTPAEYAEYDAFMKKAQATFNDMHTKVNALVKVQGQLNDAMELLPEDATELKTEGEGLLKKLKAWDEDMVQRKSKAYDDVENYPNKFTAELIFLINQTDSALPRVNEPNKARFAELMEEWEGLNKRAKELMETDIPAYNKKLWEAGVGAVKVP